MATPKMKLPSVAAIKRRTKNIDAMNAAVNLLIEQLGAVMIEYVNDQDSGHMSWREHDRKLKVQEIQIGMFELQKKVGGL